MRQVHRDKVLCGVDRRRTSGLKCQDSNNTLYTIAFKRSRAAQGLGQATPNLLATIEIQKASRRGSCGKITIPIIDKIATNVDRDRGRSTSRGSVW